MQDLLDGYRASDQVSASHEPEAAAPRLGEMSALDNADVERRLLKLRQKRNVRRQIALSLLVLDLFSILVGLVLANFVNAQTVNFVQVFRSAGIFLPFYYGIALHLNLHNASVVDDVAKSCWKAISASATSAMLVSVAIFFLGASDYFSRAVFGLGVALAIVGLCLSRVAVAKIGGSVLQGSPYAILCIYDQVKMHAKSGPGAVDVERLKLHPDLRDITFVTRLGELAHGMDKVIVHCRPSRRSDWARILNCLDVDTELAWPELDHFNPLAIKRRGGSVSLQITTGKLKWHQETIKRSFDIVITLALVPLLVPVMLITAILIRLETPGPIFFQQDRIGLGNRSFKVLKFRSMYADRTDVDGARLTERNDVRVTRVGAFIRRTSIDELPQFINVLKGEMSIVGPRPHPPKALAGTSLYWEVDSSYWNRHTLKPGITGLAQIRGHRGNTFSEQHLRDRLKADLEYVENWSLKGDLIIFLKTIFVAHGNAF